MAEVPTAAETAAAATAVGMEAAPVASVAVMGVARTARENAGEPLGARAERLVGCRGAAASPSPVTSIRYRADPWHAGTRDVSALPRCGAKGFRAHPVSPLFGFRHQ